MIKVVAVIDEPTLGTIGFGAKLQASLLQRLLSDPRINLCIVHASSYGGAPVDSAVVVNLSSIDALLISDKTNESAVVLDFRYAEGAHVDKPLSFISRHPQFRAGESAVLSHPSQVSLSAFVWRRGQGCLGSLGMWQGRSHSKSARLTVVPMIEGGYGILEWLWPHLTSGGTVESYSQFSTRSWFDQWPNGAARVFMGISYRIRYAVQTIRNRLSSDTRVQWSIGTGAIADSAAVSVPQTVSWILPTADLFVADPFLISYDGDPWVFFEELHYSENRGFLAAAPMDPSGRVAFDQRTTILARNHHLSFPSVFTNESHTYMLPEQASTRQLILYRCRKFPHDWSEDAVLLSDFEGADPVLFEHEGRWYLFVSDASGENFDNNLMLFSSERLRGPFRRHPASPIRLGLRGSRMGGHILKRCGRIIRLGQNCEERYGASLCAFEIEVLTESTYRERMVSQLLPNAEMYGDGMHSYSEMNGLVAIDGHATIRP